MSKTIFIVDLDGTLYFQIPVRIMMLLELLFYHIYHPTKLKNIKLIYKFRKYTELHSNWTMKSFAQTFHQNPLYVEKIINDWMIYRPLKWIKLFADRKLLKILQNKTVIVLSNYPTEKKLNALSFCPLNQLYYDNIHIFRQKPYPDGLEYIKKNFHCTKEQMLVIGDRFAHDGKAAINFGCDYLILKKLPFLRYTQYKDIR
ncbi:MAG: HAD family hydrolase [Alphaproteobacteria bacterium]|nr:HAD family hydrolase [Alphaproteobacteria bacterium]